MNPITVRTFELTLQRGKLLTHRKDTDAELDSLHPADRLMVRLIQLPHLKDRVNGMLYQVGFSQNLELLSKVSRRRLPAFPAVIDVQSLDILIAACNDLRDAKLFKELLNIILMMGNYMNGTNYAGGAFGFKIASINRVNSVSGIDSLSLYPACRYEIFQWSKPPAFRRESCHPALPSRVRLSG